MKRIEDITLLYEISEALNEHLDLKKSLYQVLEILSNSLNMVRGTVTILHPLRNEIHIEVAHGLSRSAMERVKYKLGEGITGRVIETGKAITIPKISDEPLFLNRTASRKSVKDESFRGDLYYRLNVFPIYMPPLRERKTDILLLADHFLEKYGVDYRHYR